MERTDLYKINLKSLSFGEHRYSYELRDSYFSSLEGSEVSAGEVYVDVVLNREGNIFRLALDYDGYVCLPCDRCLEPVELDVDAGFDLVVKFGEEDYGVDEDIIVLSERDGVLDLSWHMYEDILLSLPVQRTHESDEDCDPSMMKLYGGMRTAVEPQEDGGESVSPEKDADGVDVRWAALKNLQLPKD